MAICRQPMNRSWRTSIAPVLGGRRAGADQQVPDAQAGQQHRRGEPGPAATDDQDRDFLIGLAGACIVLLSFVSGSGLRPGSQL
jgi:hypothetical protein